MHELKHGRITNIETQLNIFWELPQLVQYPFCHMVGVVEPQTKEITIKSGFLNKVEFGDLFGKSTLRYLGPVIWNTVPLEIKQVNSLNNFISENGSPLIAQRI